MLIEKLTVGLFQENAYIIADEETRQAVIIDPGAEADRILARVQALNLDVKYLLHTHAHIDHVGATRHLREALGAPILLHRDEEGLYNGLRLQGEMFGLHMGEPLPVDYFIEDGEEFAFGKCRAKTILTPGHSPGGCSFRFNDALGTVVCGDTIFAQGIGRVDLPGGSMEVLMRSIRDRLLTLPDRTPLLPGHGPNTTVGQEKQSNPWLRGLAARSM